MPSWNWASALCLSQPGKAMIGRCEETWIFSHSCTVDEMRIPPLVWWCWIINLGSWKSRAKTSFEFSTCTTFMNSGSTEQTGLRSHRGVALLRPSTSSEPSVWQTRSHSWIFMKRNTTSVDCQAVASSHEAILNLRKIYYLWPLERPPFHFLTKHTWEN